MKIIRRSLLLALLSFAATACGTSSVLAPDDCTVTPVPADCEYVPDGGSYIPDGGS